jgi:hypothetical protein
MNVIMKNFVLSRNFRIISKPGNPNLDVSLTPLNYAYWGPRDLNPNAIPIFYNTCRVILSVFLYPILKTF